MKILVLTWACDAEDVSEPGVTHKWVEQISIDHDVTVFSVSLPERYGCVQDQFPNHTVYEWRDIRLPQSLLRFRAIAKPGYFLYYLKARRFLKKLLKTDKFDLIHHLSPFAFRYPSPAAGLGVPLVKGPIAGGLDTPKQLKVKSNLIKKLTELLRASDYLRKRYDWLLRSSFSKTNMFLYAAPYVQSVVRPLPVQNYKVEIEHGVTKEELPIQYIGSRDESKLVLLYVGRVIYTKGLRYAVQALKKITTNREIIFHIIGDGEEKPYCESIATNLPSNVKVIFHGKQNKNIVNEYYSKADVFLFPSFREPTGGVLIEAMSYGLPCITCEYGGPQSIVTPETGILVPIDEPEIFSQNLAAAIDKIASDPLLQSSMSTKARERVETFFSWEEKRKRLNEYYLEVVGGD